MMSISVCIASYNGQNYIEMQIVSILNQLKVNDEIIIVDDCSLDKTVNVISKINDKRIRVLQNNKNRGEVYSFNKAIGLSKNKYIFLSDQDDIWVDGRVSKFIKKINNENWLVTSNFTWIDEDDKMIKIEYDGVSEVDSKNNLKNIFDIYLGKTNYFGCAMCFNQNLKKLIFPIPKFIESHDLWLSLCSNFINKNYHIDDKTLLKRKHSNNTTSTISNRSLFKKTFSRLIFTLSLLLIMYRYIINKFF